VSCIVWIIFLRPLKTVFKHVSTFHDAGNPWARSQSEKQISALLLVDVWQTLGTIMPKVCTV
jgi:ABC-type sugar transport system permease subunit